MPNEDTDEDLETYGRYWIWREYFPPDTDKEVLEAAEELRKVNVAIRQDLADYYISEAMKTKTVQKAHKVDALKKVKSEGNPEEEKIRPPNLWNHPDIVEKEHKYRAHTHPHQIYIDKRIREVDARISSLSEKITSFVPLYWEELIDNTIWFFESFSSEEH
mmetsp:Transcript_26801/g.23741  ORF Transcript_26801/g.23741 Transcript_26801/m.23741 type:complete len:161 (+) Transcript_26801:1427-1909(+)